MLSFYMGSTRTVLLIEWALCISGQDFAFKCFIDIHCSKVSLNYLCVNPLIVTFNSVIGLSSALS